MKKIFYVFSFAVVSLILSSCSSSNSESSFVLEKGKYKFLMSDSSNVKIAEGELNVTGFEGDKISGNYKFKIKYKNINAFDVMNGEFSGDVNKKENKVFINTNPRIADANVFWNLKFTKSNLKGSWVYSLFRGNSTGGFVKIYK